MSAPGWASVLTGVQPSKHGIYDNNIYFMRDSDYKSFLWYGRNELGFRTLFTSDLNSKMTDAFFEEDALDMGPIE